MIKLFLLALVLNVAYAGNVKFEIINQCNYTVWPGLLPAYPSKIQPNFKIPLKGNYKNFKWSNIQFEIKVILN